MPRLFLPIEGLKLDCDWTIGEVVFRPTESAHDLLESARDESWRDETMGKYWDEVAGVLRESGVVADVVAASIEDAQDTVTDALDVLRVFHQSRLSMRSGLFGLPGQVFTSRLQYVSVGDHTGLGFKTHGHHVGAALSAKDHAAWRQSRGFRTIGELIGKSVEGEGHRRALTGIRLLSQSVLEHRPDMKLLNVVMAVDALIGKDLRPYQLARRTAYFTCDAWEPGSLCGRDRPTCPYLGLNPADDQSLRRLKRLRARADEDVRWRCSEWSNFLDRYEARSHVAHGGETGQLEDKAADRAEYWAIHVMLNPVLDWLADHPDAPMHVLESAIASLPAAPDWEAKIAES